MPEVHLPRVTECWFEESTVTLCAPWTLVRLYGNSQIADIKNNTLAVAAARATEIGTQRQFRTIGSNSLKDHGMLWNRVKAVCREPVLIFSDGKTASIAAADGSVMLEVLGISSLAEAIEFMHIEPRGRAVARPKTVPLTMVCDLD